MRVNLPGLMLLIALASAGAARAAEADVSRGKLLYETHCTECHSTQMHWRDQRLVDDWASLRAQVAQWQARARLGWSTADIEAVARHLNATVYRLPDAPVRAE